MSVSFSLPYQNSAAAAYLQTGQAVKGAQQENPGSVLKPVEEAKPKVAIQTQDSMEKSVDGQPDPKGQLMAENKLRQQDPLEARQLLLDQQRIQQLSSRDREVRNHERAHAAVGGQYAGAPRYQYERGPDGVNYAISGEVAISTGAVNGDPQATIDKAQVIRRAALAPAEPSPQDRRVAAQATQMEVQARAELNELQRQEQLEKAEATEKEKEVEDEVIEEQESQPLITEQEPKEPFFDLSEQQENFNRLSVELTRRIIGSDIESQAPRPGQIVSRFA